MTSPIEAKTLSIHNGEKTVDIATQLRRGEEPGLMWLSGFKSDMDGGKALALDDFARQRGQQCIRFDYSGHGKSGGDFLDGSISQWLAESLAVFEECAGENTILVGSSMGGWIALLMAQALMSRPNPKRRLSGLVLIAPAADFTEDLMWANFPDEVKAEITEKGSFSRPSEYSDDPYIITKKLIEDGRLNLLLGRPITTGCPVHILQGMEDPDVPWTHAQRIFEHLMEDDALITFVKDGDHRLSREQDIDLLLGAVSRLSA